MTGTYENLTNKITEVPSEGINSNEGRIQTDADEKTRISNSQASMYRIKGSNNIVSVDQGRIIW